MKISTFYAHICEAARQQRVSIPEMLSRVRAMGYEMAEVDFDDLLKDPEIPAKLRAADMGISSICCFFRFESDPAQERIDALVKTALEVGSRKVMPIPGFYTSEDPAVQAQELENMIQAMQVLVSKARAAGLEITIEDFDNATSPIRDSAGMRCMIDRLPGLNATFDSGNFAFAAEPALDAFAALRDKITHVHLKDRADRSAGSPLTAMDGRELYPCAVGEGFLPIAEVIRQLREIGYDDVVVAEHFGHTDQQEGMRRSIEFIRKHC